MQNANEETMEPQSVRTLQEAVDECQRELNIRRRCFPRWIKDGRASATDAQDRLDRLQTAIDHLTKLRDAKHATPGIALVTSSGDMTAAA